MPVLDSGDLRNDGTSSGDLRVTKFGNYAISGSTSGTIMHRGSTMKLEFDVPGYDFIQKGFNLGHIAKGAASSSSSSNDRYDPEEKFRNASIVIELLNDGKYYVGDKKSYRIERVKLNGRTNSRGVWCDTAWYTEGTGWGLPWNIPLSNRFLKPGKNEIEIEFDTSVWTKCIKVVLFDMQPQGKNWCWAASALSCANHTNDENGYTQEKIVRRRYGSPEHTGGHMSDAFRYMGKRVVVTEDAYNPENAQHNEVRQLKDLYDYLSNKVMPIDVRWHRSSNRPWGKGGHSLAIIGAFRDRVGKDMLVINDPGLGEQIVPKSEMSGYYNGSGTWYKYYKF